MKWLYNCKTKGSKESDLLADPVYWETPSFVQIRKKKTKRLSPYSETEIWDREEVLCIVKYEKRLNDHELLIHQATSYNDKIDAFI